MPPKAGLAKSELKWLRDYYGDDYEQLLVPQRDRERDRAPSPPPSPPPAHDAPRPAWSSLDKLAELGLRRDLVLKIEEYCHANGVDAHVVGYTKGNKSDIIYMGGDCWFCKNDDGSRRQHRSNHWVFIQTPGYMNCRVRCHSCGQAVTVNLYIDM